MGMRKYDVKRKEKNLRKKTLFPLENAQKLKDEYDKKMEGKKTVLVPHPEIPKTWIVKYIDK